MKSPECSDHDHQPTAHVALDPQVCQRAAGIFRALGDPGRLKVLVLLGQREMCVTEIALALDEQMTTISQRLKLLRGERLVISRRDGKHLFYSLRDDHVTRLVSNALDHAGEPDD
jgi:ArsR family transcriptional regulator, lead/cadmium/zinc/bismuth-responsive transcriptional repressor